MYIPQDVVDLIVDQLPLSADYKWRRHLQAISLVSTTWVNRSQHHLFSTVKFHHSVDIERWSSKIKPGPYGVSRHVRVLALGGRCSYTASTPRPLASDVEAALPHFVSFKNLQELILDRADITLASLEVLTPIFSSSPGILKLHLWAWHWNDIYETWKTISTVADLLPNTTHIDLLSYREKYSNIRIQLSPNEGSSLAINQFKFHELQIFSEIPHSLPFFETCGPHLQVLNLSGFYMWNMNPTDDQRAFLSLLEACHTLQVLDIIFLPGIAQFLGSIPSSSVSLIRISNPLGICAAPMTYSDSWPWGSFEEYEYYCSHMDDEDLAEFTDLGVSVRKIARRHSDNHSGLKTQVRATLALTESEIQAVENGESPVYKARLEEELGGYVNYELILVVHPPELE